MKNSVAKQCVSQTAVLVLRNLVVVPDILNIADSQQFLEGCFGGTESIAVSQCILELVQGGGKGLGCET